MSRDPNYPGRAPKVGSGPAAGSSWGPVVLVYGVRAVMLAAGLGLVGRYGSAVPYVVWHKETLLTGMWAPKELADLMRQLRDAEIGLFQHLQDDPTLHEVPLSVATVAVNQISWKAKTGHGAGADSHLTFALPDSPFLAGLRIRFEHSSHANAHFRVAWRQAGTDDFPASPQHLRLLELGPGEQTATVYIADTIDQFRIYFYGSRCSWIRQNSAWWFAEFWRIQLQRLP